MGHERMVNNQGRKVVQERVGGAGGAERSYNLFKNMMENEAQRFDQEWGAMANHLGFDNHMNNRLGFGAGDPFANKSYGDGGGGHNSRAAHGGYQDESRRGHFLPANSRS